MSAFTQSTMPGSAFAKKTRGTASPRPQAKGTRSATSNVFNPKDPLPIARAFVSMQYQHKAGQTLHYHRGAFYSWTGTHYAEVTETELRAQLYEMLGRSMRLADSKPVPFQPTSARVSDVVDALRAVAWLPDRSAPPIWLYGRSSPPPTDILPCRNGLLHLPTKRLQPATPAFFGLNAVDFDYDPQARVPDVWIAFLAQLWPDDPETICCLEEIFGYLLTTDTAHQKAFLLVGPRRSGKGTIGRVLRALLGKANVVGPTLSGLGTNFGLAPLIGKPLAILSDARLSGRADQHVIAERLLSITGEDVLTIDRKHREAWTGTLPTRFLVLTNELPRIADSSGALASRFIVLTLTQSFLGREDHQLTDRLLGLLPGILNWSIAGLERLRERGRFQQPVSATDAIQELEDLGSPIGAFIRERCTIAAGSTVRCEALFEAWKTWCKTQGRDSVGTAQTFGRDLRAAVPSLKVSRPRGNDNRSRSYEGICLR